MPTDTMSCNPPPFTPEKPGPVHVATTTNDELRARACVWMDWALAQRQHFTYTMDLVRRQHMFRSRPGSVPQECDCSQFATSILLWSGVKHGLDTAKSPLAATDATGAMLQKGKHVTAAQVRPGDAIVYGAFPGEHAVLVRERISATDFWTIGFGHQGAPDRVRHSDLVAYFNRNGHPGVTFLAYLL